jgi:hypothetical protein
MKQNRIRSNTVKIELNIIAHGCTGDTMAGQYRFYRIEGCRVRLMLFMKNQRTFFAFLPYFSIAKNKIENKSGEWKHKDHHKPGKNGTMVSPQIEHMKQRYCLRGYDK